MRLLYCITVTFILFSCNVSINADEEEVAAVSNSYRLFQRLYDSSISKESFLFFSDPHLLDGEDLFTNDVKSSLINSISPLKNAYDLLPVDFCLCGGDWLNQRDTRATAQEKLLYSDSLMKSMFSCYYKIMGNHDTNYQGFISNEDHTRGLLDRAFIDNVYFSETGSAYYSFLSNDTCFYILDSSLDYEDDLNDYKWEQIIWLASQLNERDNKHIVIGIHLFYNEDRIVPMSQWLLKVCDAYNSGHILSLFGEQYDYSSKIGKIHLILAGHNHIKNIDYVGDKKDIPVVRVCNYQSGGLYNYFACLINYEAMNMEMVNVETGDVDIIGLCK